MLSVLEVHVTPSGDVAPTLSVSFTARNTPCPYSTWLQVLVAGSVVSVQLTPLSNEIAALVPEVFETATNLLLPYVTDFQFELESPVPADHVVPLSSEYATFDPPLAIATQ